MLNSALADKKTELTSLDDRLKKGREEEGALKKEDKKEDKPDAAAPEEASGPTKQMVEHLETQNRKLHASFDAFKKEIA